MNTDSIIDIRTAIVVDTTDPSRSGCVWAHIEGFTAESTPIQYTSPFGTNGQGGMVAIPTSGTKIIVCSPMGTSKWFYMSTCFESEPNQAEGGKISDTEISPVERAKPDLYSARGIAQGMQVKGQRGGGLEINESYAPEGNVKGFNVSTRVKSPKGKKVTLSDNPHTDAISLETPGVTLKITDNPKSGVSSPNAFDLRTEGPTSLKCRSEMDLVVGVDGREVNILNTAQGATWGDTINQGNINIQSKHKDVNVFSKGVTGRIFIETINEEGQQQLIQLQTRGPDSNIVIKATGKVMIDADQGLELNSQSDINITSGSNVNIRAAGTINNKTGGNFNVDASEVHLAEPASVPSANTSLAQESTYGSAGITKYK